MARIVGSRCVLAVQDLALSTRYYVDVLGFKLDFQVPGWSFLSRDSFGVMLGECSDAPPAGDLGDHSYFAYINVDGLDDYFSQVQAQGGRILKRPRNEPWGMREFAVETIDGHRIMFGTRIDQA